MSRPPDTNRSASSFLSKIRLFSPILPGATLRDRLLACLGALLGIGLTSLMCALLLGADHHLPLIAAPIGAAGVLLFAVPSSPLAQPWSIVGGNTLSALTGTLVSFTISEPIVAAGVAVSAAIAIMSLTRSLHPPGGAAALTPVVGGPLIANWGLMFPVVIGLNALVLVGLGIAFHRLSGRNYPHVALTPPVNTHGTSDPPSPLRAGFLTSDIDAALEKIDEAFDIDRDDLAQIVREVELQAAMRSHGDITCADIMSRDVIAIRPDATRQDAISLLLRHNIRLLPVKDSSGRLLGAVGLRELVEGGDAIADVVSPAATAAASDRAAALLPVLTDGKTHAVVIVDEKRRVLGLISQTDLLSALGRSQPKASAKELRLETHPAI